MRILKQMAPFGPDNPAPVFKACGVFDSGYAAPVGKDKTHLKGAMSQNGEEKIPFIAFKLADKESLLRNHTLVDIVFNLSENIWQGKTTLQLQLLDIKPLGS
jgi:single-stranded-DNA-specific exonuclease